MKLMLGDDVFKHPREIVERAFKMNFHTQLHCLSFKVLLVEYFCRFTWSPSKNLENVIDPLSSVQASNKNSPQLFFDSHSSKVHQSPT